MNKKVQFVFVLILSLSFVVVTILVLLNAQGYDFDLNKGRIVQTGGVYVKTLQVNTAVFIDDKYENVTSSFTRDLLVQKLLPGTHNIKIKRDGYFTWEKNLKVEEQLVTKAQNVILFPENISFSSLMTEVKNVFEIDEFKFLIQKTDNQLVFFDAINNTNRDILSAKEFESIGEIKKIEFSPDKQKALITAKSLKYYLLFLDEKTVKKLQLIEGLDKTIEKPEFNGNNNIYYISKDYLYSLNLTTNKKELVKEAKIKGFCLHGDGLYTLENGILIRTNVYIKTEETLTKAAFLFKDKHDYQLKTIEGRIFLVEDGKIYYFYNNPTKSFIKVIQSSSQEIKYRSWSDKVMFTNGNEIWLMLLKDFESPFFKKADSFIFLSRFSEKINDVAWIDDDYFSAIIGGKLRISEIDVRDRVNFFELPGENYSNIWFNKDEKALIVLNNGELQKSSEILP